MSVCIIGGSIGCVDLGGGVDWWIDGAIGQEEDGAFGLEYGARRR